MNIDKIPTGYVKISDYSSQKKNKNFEQSTSQTTPSSNTNEKKKDYYQTSTEPSSIYTDMKKINDAQLLSKFTQFSNKQIGNQLGNMKAYMEGFIDGSDTNADSLKALQDKLFERYGISIEFDPSSVEEGGYYSAEKTSDRLVEFAINISDGDTSKADLLLDAVKKGFEQAKEIWGDELPEISQETYTLTVEKFELFASN